MKKIKNMFSSLKKTIQNKLSNLKTPSQKFKENFKKVKSQPKSKRKSLFLGFTTVVSIFGVTLLTPVLSAIAKDVPKNNPATPAEACPQPASAPKPKFSQEIINGVSGVAGSVCALAVTSGSFLVGAACGVIVVVGILRAQGN